MATTQLQRIERIHNAKYKPSGPKSYVYLLRKYNFCPTMEGPYYIGSKMMQQGKHGTDRAVGGKAHTQKVLKKKDPTSGETGDVTAEDQQNDSEYICPVTIGTPGKTFNLDFDTGSADLWVWSTELPSSVKSAKGHNVFDPKQSSTFKATTGSSWKISYGDNSSASGTVGTDNIVLGGLVVKNQAIELAKTLSQQFQEDSSDGLLGLAWGSINTVTPKPVQTPVENMILQDDIPKDMELFTAHLGSWRDAADPNNEGASFYTFGYIDAPTLAAANVAESQIYYTPVDNSQGFWMFASTSAGVNGTSIPRNANTAIADTGTTLCLVDDVTCKAIYAAIPGAKYDATQQGYIFPTGTTADQLPTVTFAVGDQQFAVQKEALAFAAAEEGFVYGGIQSRGDMTFDILGDVFLKGVYAIFDQGNTRFGCVQRTLPTQNTAAPSS
ncbi:MAG: aspartic endopeptidase [Lasallia pustulata]|uniref:Aspartic endopeptidase n=1 Tax=Lasallia pustulata TaxID=136370 RepID=A0A5M8PZI2_9LECA|nr:MAG: aspartic endopeptidase [Lasallia pustulata]